MTTSAASAARKAWETRRITRAISIRKPYAEQILCGIKTREYRSVPTNIRERVYVYASEKPGDWQDYDLLGFHEDDLPRGLLVGTVEIVGCEPEPRTGGFAYLLRDPRRLARAIKPDNKPQPIWFRPFGSAGTNE